MTERNSFPRTHRKFPWLIMKALAVLMLAPLVLWCVPALWIDGPESRVFAGVLVGLFLGGAGAMAVLLRPFWRSWGGMTALVLAVLGWWLTLAPSNERDWRPEVARLPSARIEGSHAVIENVRNFDYRTEDDFTEGWETREYDLDGVRAFDIFICSWGSPMIVHTIASWEFEDGRHLAISIETRKENDEAYSAVKGFFRQFELYYVVADERDVVRLRTNFRGEKVHVYRIRREVGESRALLEQYLKEINRLAERPRWYNAVTHNCTTSIRQNTRHVAKVMPWDIRILLNGRIDEYGYEQGLVDTSLPFEEMKELSDITERARAAGDSADFSRLIRAGLPLME